MVVPLLRAWTAVSMFRSSIFVTSLLNLSRYSLKGSFSFYLIGRAVLSFSLAVCWEKTWGWTWWTSLSKWWLIQAAVYCTIFALCRLGLWEKPCREVCQTHCKAACNLRTWLCEFLDNLYRKMIQKLGLWSFLVNEWRGYRLLEENFWFQKV